MSASLSLAAPDLPVTSPIPAFPALRLLPIPETAPPYDDLGRATATSAPPMTAAVPALRLVPAPTPSAGPLPAMPAVAVVSSDDADEMDHRTALAELPPARPFALALVQRLLEVMAGVRPIAQLQHDTSVELFEALEGTLIGRPRPGGLRPNRRAVRSLHLQERPEGVAEVCATVDRGPRLAAFALRLEGRDGRWRCMELAGV